MASRANADGDELFRGLDWWPSNQNMRHASPSVGQMGDSLSPRPASSSRSVSPQGMPSSMTSPERLDSTVDGPNNHELTSLGPGLLPNQPSPSRSGSQQGPPSSIIFPGPANGAADGAAVPQDPRDRVVNRKLRGIHVFMITISGVLGVGLYIRSGSILRMGGPGAVLIATTVMGLLAWMVMQCIGEMLTLWPISGALVEYVGTFVDEDLGIAVGLAYWFTYAISTAALIVGAAGALDFWDPGKAIQGTVMFFIVPLVIVFVNSFGVQIYGLSEVIGGSLKIIGIIVVIFTMIAINVGAGAEGHIGTKYFKYDTIFPYDPRIGDSWASALFIAFSVSAFAYVGVDITAATALEARPDRRNVSGGGSLWPSISVRFVATWTSFIIWAIYFIAGILMSFNVHWEDPALPVASWLGSPVKSSSSPSTVNSDSGFVISAAASKIPGLADMVTSIIIITAIFSANTNLYVASRALFVLTRKIHSSRWPWSWLAYFGRTNNYKVPVRAMLISCCFLWVPFLYLSPNNSPHTTISSLLEVLSQMGSVSCIIVWMCESWAFIRFYNCLYRHRDRINRSEQFRRLRRFPQGPEDYYPWRSHGQPVIMYVAVFGCLFVLIIADGSALWSGFFAPGFLSAYLAPICFLVLWFGIKLTRWGSMRLQLEDLSDFDVVAQKFRYLNEIEDRAAARDSDEEQRGWPNLWGIM